MFKFAIGAVGGAVATVALQIFLGTQNTEVAAKHQPARTSAPPTASSTSTADEVAASAKQSSILNKTDKNKTTTNTALTSTTNKDDAKDKCECGVCYGRYKVGKKLGEGAFGITFLAQDRQTNRTVCLKFTKMPNTNELNEALAECVFLTEVKHRHIVCLRDFFAHIAPNKEAGSDEIEKQAQLVICMDYANGGDLHHYVKKYEEAKTHLPEKIMLKFVNQLVHAVHFIHSKNIIHRDLKPENVLLSRRELPSSSSSSSSSSSTAMGQKKGCVATDGEDVWDIKVADFGLSKFIDLAEYEEQRKKQLARAQRRNRRRPATTSSSSSSSNSNSSNVANTLPIDFDPRLAMSQAGTPGYMAPEMTVSGTTRANKKVDVWSLGCIFLELATGRLLEDGEPQRKHWLRERLLSIPTHYTCKKPLIALITACIQVNPDKRASLHSLMQMPLIAVHNDVLRTLQNPQQQQQRTHKRLHSRLHPQQYRHHRGGRVVPQSVPLNNRSQTRLLSPTGVFDRPDNVPLHGVGFSKRQKVAHFR